ncbi:PPOX class F420-dependent oxidoreductase [Candidatus Protofrankia californiensis]|uniref:PPOX class F420-dependent oxidoreductase n=1 Tax=Candidatus Protofrankia californiensis TaxID=1839754 RepID=UPI00104113F6|nr:PPOX class F420-dependent oxidoreductase [Candidatus Protofrankia californiensis]
MDIEAARAYVRDNHQAVLATFRQDGTPQMSPVTVGVDTGGRLVISSRETAYKVRNLYRDPRASLCVFPDSFFGPWIQVSGRARIISLPEAMEALVDYYRTLSGEHPDWDDYRAAMVRDQRCVISIEIEHAGPDRSG